MNLKPDGLRREFQASLGNIGKPHPKTLGKCFQFETAGEASLGWFSVGYDYVF